MKKKKIKDTGKPHILKELPEDRKERVRLGKSMRTQVVPDKRKKTRTQQKHDFIKSERED